MLRHHLKAAEAASEKNEAEEKNFRKTKAAAKWRLNEA